MIFYNITQQHCVIYGNFGMYHATLLRVYDSYMRVREKKTKYNKRRGENCVYFRNLRETKVKNDTEK